MNPDGVARGAWRFDTNGINLNRVYVNPDPKTQSVIFKIKEQILKDHNRDKLKLFIDFHAHRARRGCFVYGNTQSNDIEK